jgi:hypothetical protein
MKKTVDKIPFYRLGWNKRNYFYETNLEKMKESIDLFCKVK